MYPKLKILINKEFDKVICEKFINRQKAGIDFGGGIIKIHPELEAAGKAKKEEAREIISDYFDKFYSDFMQEIGEAVKIAKKEWERKENVFYTACDKYFNNHPWPKGKYEAYLSIISCNPRFLEDKTFQFYWKNKYDFPYVATHEMLHFLFYDLVAKMIPGTDIQDENIWKISEVFNGLVMVEKEFISVTGVEKPHQYPDLVQLQERLKKVWDKNKKADRFIHSTLISANIR